jgi:hypothetical protein
VRREARKAEAEEVNEPMKRHQLTQWDGLIALAEARLERSRIKTMQLEALLKDFRAQAKAGERCPTEIAVSAERDFIELLQIKK